jgi:hypothetical protein
MINMQFCISAFALLSVSTSACQNQMQQSNAEKSAVLQTQTNVQVQNIISFNVSDIKNIKVYRQITTSAKKISKEAIVTEFISGICPLSNKKNVIEYINKSISDAKKYQSNSQDYENYNAAIEINSNSGKTIIYFGYDTKEKILINDTKYAVNSNFDNKIIEFSEQECGMGWQYKRKNKQQTKTP